MPAKPKIQFPATREELIAAGWRLNYSRNCRLCHAPIDFWWTGKKYAPLDATKSCPTSCGRTLKPARTRRSFASRTRKEICSSELPAMRRGDARGRAQRLLAASLDLRGVRKRVAT